MTRLGRNDPNVHIVIPREQSCTAETASIGLDTFRGNRPRLDVTTSDGRKIAVYMTPEQVSDLVRAGSAVLRDDRYYAATSGRDGAGVVGHESHAGNEEG